MTYLQYFLSHFAETSLQVCVGRINVFGLARGSLELRLFKHGLPQAEKKNLGKGGREFGKCVGVGRECLLKFQELDMINRAPLYRVVELVGISKSPPPSHLL